MKKFSKYLREHERKIINSKKKKMKLLTKELPESYENIFVNIIKIVTVFIKRILIDSKKVKRIKSYGSKLNLYLYFLIYKNFLIFIKKMLMSA